MEYKREKVNKEKDRLGEVIREIEDPYYKAALRAAGAIKQNNESNAPDPIRERCDNERLKQPNGSNEKLIVPKFPPELAEMKQ